MAVRSKSYEHVTQVHPTLSSLLVHFRFCTLTYQLSLSQLAFCVVQFLVKLKLDTKLKLVLKIVSDLPPGKELSQLIVNSRRHFVPREVLTHALFSICPELLS